MRARAFEKETKRRGEKSNVGMKNFQFKDSIISRDTRLKPHRGFGGRVGLCLLLAVGFRLSLLWGSSSGVDSSRLVVVFSAGVTPSNKSERRRSGT